MGLDARTRYTKMMIRNSFLELLKVQPVAKITVKRICEMAEINRATFYKYYDDAFDLLGQIEEELLGEIQESIAIENLNPENISEFLVLLLRFISEKKDWFFTLSSENGDRQFGARIFATCYQNTSFLIQKYFPQLSPTRRKQLYYYLARGFGGVLHCWIEDGMKETPEETAAFIETLLRNSVKGI